MQKYSIVKNWNFSKNYQKKALSFILKPAACKCNPLYVISAFCRLFMSVLYMCYSTYCLGQYMYGRLFSKFSCLLNKHLNMVQTHNQFDLWPNLRLLVLSLTSDPISDFWYQVWPLTRSQTSGIKFDLWPDLRLLVLSLTSDPISDFWY